MDKETVTFDGIEDLHVLYDPQTERFVAMGSKKDVKAFGYDYMKSIDFVLGYGGTEFLFDRRVK